MLEQHPGGEGREEWPTFGAGDPFSEVKIGVVVVNFGMAQEIAAALGQSLAHPSVNVVIVDNYSSDAEAARCRELGSRFGWSIISNSRNLGFGSACNIGAAHLVDIGSTHLLFLNPDASITLDALRRLVERSVADPNSIVAPTIVRTGSGDVWFCGGQINWLTGTAYHFAADAPDRHIDWLTGACLLVPRSAWNVLKGFDESYFLYWEDVELTHRWKRQGGRLTVVADAVAEHAVGLTQGDAQSKSAIYLYFNLVNRARFGRTFTRGGLRLLWLLSSPIYTGRLMNMSRSAFASRKFGSYASALFRGVVASVVLLIGFRGTDRSR
jgi:GT2 family glycosyltransferase